MFSGAIRVGRVAGIDIAVDYSLFFIGLFVVWQVNTILSRLENANPTLNLIIGVMSAFLFFFSILWHELAHGLMAQVYRVRVRRIVLFFMGGIAEIQDEPRSAVQEFAIAFVGPLSSLILGGIFWAVQLPLAHDTPLAIALRWLGLINMLLAVFNMLPGFPLDGARVLRALLWWGTGSHLVSTRFVSYFGQLMAFGLLMAAIIGMFMGNSQLGNPLLNLFMSWFLWNASRAHLRSATFRAQMQGTPIGALVSGNIALKADWPLSYAADIIATGRPYSAIPVMRGDDLVGVISMDLIYALPKIGRGNIRIETIMQPIHKVRTVPAEMDVYDALRETDLNRDQFLLVMNQQSPLGLVSKYELVAYVEARAR